MDDFGNYCDKDNNETTDPTQKVLIKSSGEEFNGTLQGQKGFSPKLNSDSKSKPKTKEYKGDDGKY